MLTRLRETLLPASQRRTVEELALELDPETGDVVAKRSAFWSMLVLSAVIASAGVLTDSTATVIGAMIIAPLSTPIMGTALSIVTQQRSKALLRVTGGAAAVVLIGILFAALLPGVYDLHTNSQITGRTSPGLFDLLAALATGLAGAVALARRDVGAVLPGVAIAISLVPPLAVVGVCLGQGAYAMAAGAAVLFASNFLSLVIAGTFVFAVLGYTAAARDSDRRKRRTHILLGSLLAAMAVPLAANTAFTTLTSVWTARVTTVARDWIAVVPGAEVTGVDRQATTFYVHVRTPSDLPPTADLMARLSSQVPAGLQVVVETTTGERIRAGDVD